MGKKRNQDTQQTTEQQTEEQKLADQQTEEQLKVAEGNEGSETAGATEGSESGTVSGGDDADAEAAAAAAAVEQQTEVEQPGAGKGDEVEVVEVEEGVELNLNCVNIAEYAVDMGPKKPNDKLSIAKNQMKLYNAVNAIINNLEGKAFVEAYSQALEIMNENSATFADNLLFRGFAEMRIPPASRQRFENILVLMSSTADPENRATALKAIDFQAFAKGFSDDAIQKIRAFYQVK